MVKPGPKINVDWTENPIPASRHRPTLFEHTIKLAEIGPNFGRGQPDAVEHGPMWAESLNWAETSQMWPARAALPESLVAGGSQHFLAPAGSGPFERNPKSRGGAPET